MKTQLLIVLLVISLNASAQINLNNGLRALYAFNGNANDFSGNSFDGIVNGATLTQDRFGVSNSAYHFDGTNQNITVQGFQNMITADEFSMSCWVKVDNTKSQSIGMLFPDEISDRFYASVYYDHNGAPSTFWDYGAISGGRLGSVGTYFQPVWEHYVFIVSASQNIMQVYRNGYLQFMKTGMNPLMNKNKTFCIGGGMGDGGMTNHYFSGSIDDVRIYDRVLNPAEIMSLNHGYYESTVNDLRVFVTNFPNPRPGFPEMLNVVYQNVGNTTLSGYVELNYDTNYSFVQSSPVQDSISANYLGWNVSNLAPGSQGFFQVEMNLPSSVALGTLLTSTAVINPIVGDTMPVDNYDTLVQTVVGGYDPNYIEVSPSSDILKDFVENGNYLYYTVHFQNTGTASAINVRIEKTLDPNFSVSSVEVIGASHNYTWTLDNSNLLKFNFDNINLPDSGTSLSASNGFVIYKIKPLPTLQVGDQMSNSANIFFDFNAAVVTNTVITKIINPLTVNENVATYNSVVVYPNPSADNIAISFNAAVEGTTQIMIFNSFGALVKENTVFVIKGNNLIDLNTVELASGIYLIRIADKHQTTITKWVKY